MAFDPATMARLKALASRYLSQSSPSINPETPNATIKDDIQDALEDTSPEFIMTTIVPNALKSLIQKTELPPFQTSQINMETQSHSMINKPASLEFPEKVSPVFLSELLVLVKQLAKKQSQSILSKQVGQGHLTQMATNILLQELQELSSVHTLVEQLQTFVETCPQNCKSNCITIHKLLEYQPVYYTVMDDASGEERTKMVFEPTRTRLRPLPDSIHTIIFEESSMLGTDLYKEVVDACPHKPQEIFLGDIQQLPPVFGPAILGFKLLELPVVELTEVYRQALESPIIALAHRILSAVPIPVSEFPDWKKPGQMTIRAWQKKISPDDALNTMALVFCGNKHVEQSPDKQHTGFIEGGIYNPDEDIILIPFNKSFGTDELNKRIANYLARANKRDTYQVIAGFNRLYFSVGDKVLYDKEDATVLAIQENPAYSGARAVPHSKTLDYWGYDPAAGSLEEMNDDETDFLLTQVANASSSEERVKQASHIITLQMNDSDVEVRVDKAGDLNALMLGYCLTVHKSQGSEWRKVFFVCHQSHATMLQRELLYTAVTRAREELYIICEPETFVNGIRSQRVKGNTLAEKAEFFKGKVKDQGELYGK
jgi:ATP-dependent exoDNAse (exonuclease V) alpha subunit